MGGGAGVWQGACMAGGVQLGVGGMVVHGRGGMHRRGVHGRGGGPCRRDDHWSGRFASYWNAFLLVITFYSVVCAQMSDWWIIMQWMVIRLWQHMRVPFQATWIQARKGKREWSVKYAIRKSRITRKPFNATWSKQKYKNSPIRGWGGLSKMSKKCPKCPQLNYLD